jgi:hypothetical protein
VQEDDRLGPRLTLLGVGERGAVDAERPTTHRCG